MIWSWDDTLGNTDDEVSLRAKGVVAAHDKDINSLAVSPNDGLVCSGSEVRLWLFRFLEARRCLIWFTSLDCQCIQSSSLCRTELLAYGNSRT
jgi:predicted nuclease of predicted toxin-antitoxin system